jgi:hypothetical protein
MMFGLAAVSLIVYVIGSIRNRRIVVNYSKMVKEEAFPLLYFYWI